MVTTPETLTETQSVTSSQITNASSATTLTPKQENPTESEQSTLFTTDEAFTETPITTEEIVHIYPVTTTTEKFVTVTPQYSTIKSGIDQVVKTGNQTETANTESASRATQPEVITMEEGKSTAAQPTGEDLKYSTPQPEETTSGVHKTTRQLEWTKETYTPKPPSERSTKPSFPKEGPPTTPSTVLYTTLGDLVAQPSDTTFEGGIASTATSRTVALTATQPTELETTTVFTKLPETATTKGETGTSTPVNPEGSNATTKSETSTSQAGKEEHASTVELQEGTESAATEGRILSTGPEEIEFTTEFSEPTRDQALSSSGYITLITQTTPATVVPYPGGTTEEHLGTTQQTSVFGTSGSTGGFVTYTPTEPTVSSAETELPTEIQRQTTSAAAARDNQTEISLHGKPTEGQLGTTQQPNDSDFSKNTEAFGALTTTQELQATTTEFLKKGEEIEKYSSGQTTEESLGTTQQSIPFETRGSTEGSEIYTSTKATGTSEETETSAEVSTQTTLAASLPDDQKKFFHFGETTEGRVDTTHQPDTSDRTEKIGTYPPTQTTVSSPETETPSEVLNQTTSADSERDDEKDISDAGETTEKKLGTTQQPIAANTSGSTEGFITYPSTETTVSNSKTATHLEVLRETTSAATVQDGQKETSRFGETTEGKVGTTQQPIASETSTVEFVAHITSENLQPTSTEVLLQSTRAGTMQVDQTEKYPSGKPTEESLATTQQSIPSDSRGSTEGFTTEPTSPSAETATPTDYLKETSLAATMRDDQKETTAGKRGTTEQSMTTESSSRTEEAGAYTPAEPTAPGVESATPTEYSSQTPPADAQDVEKEITSFMETTEGKLGTTQQPIVSETSNTAEFRAHTDTMLVDQTEKSSSEQTTERIVGTTQQRTASDTTTSTEEMSPEMDRKPTIPPFTEPTSLLPSSSEKITGPGGPTTTEYSSVETSKYQTTTTAPDHTTEVGTEEIRQSTVESEKSTTINEIDTVFTTRGSLVTSPTTSWGIIEQTSLQSEGITVSTESTSELAATAAGTTFESGLDTTQKPAEQSTATGHKTPEQTSTETISSRYPTTLSMKSQPSTSTSEWRVTTLTSEHDKTAPTTEWKEEKSEATTSYLAAVTTASELESTVSSEATKLPSIETEVTTEPQPSTSNTPEKTVSTESTSTLTSSKPSETTASEAELATKSVQTSLETSSQQTSTFITSPIVTYVYEQTSIKASVSTGTIPTEPEQEATVSPEYTTKRLITEAETETPTLISSTSGLEVQNTTPSEGPTEKSELMESTKELAKETATQVYTTEKVFRSSTVMEEGTSTRFTPAVASESATTPSESSTERGQGVAPVEGIATNATTFVHTSTTPTLGETSTFSSGGTERFSTVEQLAKETSTHSYISELSSRHTTSSKVDFSGGTFKSTTSESMETPTVSSQFSEKTETQYTTLGYVTEQASTTLEAELSSKSATLIPTTETSQISTEHPQKVSELTTEELSTLGYATEKPLEYSGPPTATYTDTTILMTEEIATVSSTKSVTEVTIKTFSTLSFDTEKSAEYSTGTSTSEGTTVSPTEESETSSSEVSSAETTHTSTSEMLPSEKELEEKSTEFVYTTESYSQYSTSTGAGSTESHAYEASTPESTQATSSPTKEAYETPGEISTVHGIDHETTTLRPISEEDRVTETAKTTQTTTVVTSEALKHGTGTFTTISEEKYATDESTRTSAAGTETARVTTTNEAPTTEEVQRSTLPSGVTSASSSEQTTTGSSAQFPTSAEAGSSGTTESNAFETAFTTIPESSAGGLTTLEENTAPFSTTAKSILEEAQTTEELTASSARSSEHHFTTSMSGLWTVQKTDRISTTAVEGLETTTQMISSSPSTLFPSTKGAEYSEGTSIKGPSTEIEELTSVPFSIEPDFGTKALSTTEPTKVTNMDQSTIADLANVPISSIAEATTKLLEEITTLASTGDLERSTTEPQTTRRITTEEQPSSSTSVEEIKSTLAYSDSTSEATELTIQPLTDPGTASTESSGNKSEYLTAGTISTGSPFAESTTYSDVYNFSKSETTFMSSGTTEGREVTTGYRVQYGTATEGLVTTELLFSAATQESTAGESISTTAEGIFTSTATSQNEPLTSFATEYTMFTPPDQSTEITTTETSSTSSKYATTPVPKFVTDNSFGYTESTSETTTESLVKLSTKQIGTERLTTETGRIESTTAEMQAGASTSSPSTILETTTGYGEQNETSKLQKGITTENIGLSSEAAIETTARTLPQQTLSYRNKQNGDEFTTYYPSTLPPTTEKYFTVFEKEPSSSVRIPSMDALVPTGEPPNPSQVRGNQTTPAPPSSTATMETAAGFTVETVTVTSPQTGMTPVSSTEGPMEIPQQPPGGTANPVETSTGTPLAFSITFTSPTIELTTTTESYTETPTTKYLGDISTFSTVLSTKEVEEIMDLGRTTIKIDKNEKVEVTTPAYTMQETASTTETVGVRHTVQMSTEQLKELTTMGTTMVSKVLQTERTTQQSGLREPTGSSTEDQETSTETSTLSATTEPVLTTTVVIATNHSVISISNYTNEITNRTVECLVDNDCEDTDVCIFKKCINVCTIGGLCASNAKCTAENHAADCTCPPHHYGDPHRMCYPGILILLADFLLFWEWKLRVKLLTICPNLNKWRYC